MDSAIYSYASPALGRLFFNRNSTLIFAKNGAMLIYSCLKTKRFQSVRDMTCIIGTNKDRLLFLMPHHVTSDLSSSMTRVRVIDFC